MKKKSTLLLIVLGLVVLIGGASVLYSQLGDSEANNSQTADKKILAPDFMVYDADGNASLLSDYRGKPVVINFWASWCGPCKSEMPAFDAAAAELEGKVTFLMVNMTDGSQETLESASSFIRAEGYSFPVYYDTEQNAATVYSVTSLPTTYFVDAEGYGIARAMGAISAEDLQRGIDMIYQE